MNNFEVFAFYMQCCFRVMNHDASEKPNRDKIKAYMAAIMPTEILSDEQLARWHFHYVQSACQEASIVLDRMPKEDRTIECFIEESVKHETTIASSVELDARRVSLLCRILDKEWVQRLFLVPKKGQVSADVRLDSNPDGIFAAAALMTISKRNGYWPAITPEESTKDWALHVIRRMA